MDQKSTMIYVTLRPETRFGEGSCSVYLVFVCFSFVFYVDSFNAVINSSCLSVISPSQKADRQIFQTVTG